MTHPFYSTANGFTYGTPIRVLEPVCPGAEGSKKARAFCGRLGADSRKRVYMVQSGKSSKRQEGFSEKIWQMEKKGQVGGKNPPSAPSGEKKKNQAKMIKKTLTTAWEICIILRGRCSQPSFFLGKRIDKVVCSRYNINRTPRNTGVWPSGKAKDFGSFIPGSNPGTPARGAISSVGRAPDF